MEAMLERSTGVAAGLCLLSTLWAGPARAGLAACLGDCDASGSVEIDELVKGLNIALGSAASDSCPAFVGTPTIDALLDAVENALAGCPGPPAGEPLDPAGCEAAGLAIGETTVVEIEHEGIARNYRVYVPSGIDPGSPTPMVVNWHGLNSSALRQELYAGDAIAEERGTIVAYPSGLGDPGGQSFNGGNCCSQFGRPPHMADDVGFGRAIVADVARKICVDRRRIYSTGMSNGGYMSDYNACEAADLYAAVVPVSALGIPRRSCNPIRPIPILSFNGTEDPLVFYGVSQQSMRLWAERNGCAGEPAREDLGASYCLAWDDCEAGVEVEACTVTGMEHCWPGNPLILPGFCTTGGLDDIDANQRMYDFFARHVLP
jgi:polyhydroxybutyrate depolymerase